MYLMNCTRLDIAFAIGKLSRFTHNPNYEYWKEIDRLLRYLKGTANYMLQYSGIGSILECYSDGDQAFGKIDSKSINR